MSDEKSFQYVKIMLPLFRAVVKFCITNKLYRPFHCTLDVRDSCKSSFCYGSLTVSPPAHTVDSYLEGQKYMARSWTDLPVTVGGATPPIVSAPFGNSAIISYHSVSFAMQPYLSVSIEKILSKLKNLDSTKASPFGSIPLKIFTEHSDLFAPLVQFFINKSMAKGEFPKELKKDDTTSLLRNGDAFAEKN